MHVIQNYYRNMVAFVINHFKLLLFIPFYNCFNTLCLVTVISFHFVEKNKQDHKICYVTYVRKYTRIIKDLNGK